jgi:type III pantothenate kinase
MFLCVNVGNTHIVLGLYEEETLRAVWRVSSVPWRTEDEYRVLFRNMLRESAPDLGGCAGCMVASVVPRLTQTLLRSVKSLLGIDAMVLSHDLDLGVGNLYERPEDVGPDRLANAAGGIARYGAPLIVVDSGTATTFDVVSADRAYIGGIIMPGLEMAAEALFQKTSRLPRIAIAAPRELIGRTTMDAIASGLVRGTAGAVDSLVAQIREALGAPACPAVATGGCAEIIAPFAKSLTHVDPDLTLYGMLKIWQRNRKSDPGPPV